MSSQVIKPDFTSLKSQKKKRQRHAPKHFEKAILEALEDGPKTAYQIAYYIKAQAKLNYIPQDRKSWLEYLRYMRNDLLIHVSDEIKPKVGVTHGNLPGASKSYYTPYFYQGQGRERVWAKNPTYHKE